MKKERFMDMLKAGEQVFAPCVWDCYSAKAAELAGFRAMMLSGASVSRSMVGAPDLGVLNIEELIWATDRICNFSPLPLIVDADEGYGDSPLNTYHNMSRLVKAGAQGFTLDDGMGIRGYVRMPKYYPLNQGRHPYELMPTEQWLAKLKAALAAIEGTDCVLIARTEVRVNEGLDEAIDRCRRAQDLGAHMTMINKVIGLEEARYVHERVDGWKMYPDIVSHNGETDADLKELMSLNFNFVTIHYLEKASIYGMMKFGKQVRKDGSTACFDGLDLGMTPEEQQAMLHMDHPRWLEKEAEWMGR